MSEALEEPPVLLRREPGGEVIGVVVFEVLDRVPEVACDELSPLPRERRVVRRVERLPVVDAGGPQPAFGPRTHARYVTESVFEHCCVRLNSRGRGS